MSSKTLFALVAALAVMPAAASAQLATGQVDVSATVDAYAAITGTGDVLFGNLSRTLDNIIDPAGGPNSAQRTVTFNSNVDITFSSVPTTLAGPNSATLAVTLNCAHDDGAGWSTPVACSTATFSVDNTTTGLATSLLGFGGVITAAAVQSVPAGSYGGSFNVVVTAR